MTNWIGGLDFRKLNGKSAGAPDSPAEESGKGLLLDSPLLALGALVVSLVLVGLYYDLRLALILAGISALIPVIKLLGLYPGKAGAIFSVCLPVFILLYFSGPKLMERAPDYREFVRWASEGFDADFSMENKLAEKNPDIVEIVRLIRAETNEDEKIIVWGWAPIIYFLTDRRPASRFTWDYPLTVDRRGIKMTESFARFQRRSRKEFSEDVIANRPKFAVVMQNDLSLINHKTSVQKLKVVPDFKDFLSEDYDLIREYYSYLVYKLRADPAS